MIFTTNDPFREALMAIAQTRVSPACRRIAEAALALVPEVSTPDDGACSAPLTESLPHANPPPPAPSGEWVTVPREPTEAMLLSGEVQSRRDTPAHKLSPKRAAADTYSAMLSAAPSPSPTGGDSSCTSVSGAALQGADQPVAPSAGDARAFLDDFDALGLHPETARLVRNFARALAYKLREAEKKYGYSDGWRTEPWEAECQRQLLAHVAKGDPLDVAAYAAFCWSRRWATTPVAELCSLSETLPELSPSVPKGEGRMAFSGIPAAVPQAACPANPGVKLEPTCDILPPNFQGDMVGATGCPLPHGHMGPHQTTAHRHGQVEWAFDYECGCCEPDEPDRCIWFGRPANVPTSGEER